jgi:hypothetical protein
MIYCLKILSVRLATDLAAFARGTVVHVLSVRFFFSFGVLQLMLLEAPQHYGLLYYPRMGRSNFLHQFRAAHTP